MDRTHYITEALRQLNNPEFYQPLPKPIYTDSIPIFRDIIQDLNQQGFINHKQARYLCGETEPRQRHFYLLPKIHKPRDSWLSPHMAPGRPIVSDCGSESYRIAEYIDYYLNPLSTLHKSYIKDTYDFVEKVKNIHLEKDSFLFSIDIDSLYTNIETQLGLQAIKNIFNQHPRADRPDRAIQKLLTLSLEKNDFVFNDKVYLQTKGTAMGKKFAPAYANIYMAQWEETILPKCPKQPTHYFRYLDDIWGTWPYSEQDFKEFIEILNNHHRSIKVKYSLNLQSIDFLDTTTFKGPTFDTSGSLDIKVFFKDTDTHALLHKKSFHPKHTFAGIVKSQLIRFDRICTRPDDFQQAKRTLFQALRQRGYSRWFLRTVYKQWEQEKLGGNPSRDPETNKGIIPLIIPFSETAKSLAHKIKENFRRTCQDTEFSELWRVMPAYRRHKNLQDLLVRSKLTNSTVCPTRKYSQLLVKNHATKEVFRRSLVALNRDNNVYLITCMKCNKQYVGQTKNSIKTRLQAHRYNILHNRKRHTHLVSHFRRHGIRKMRTIGLEHNPNWSLQHRLFKERQWINRLQSTFPFGLNEK